MSVPSAPLEELRQEVDRLHQLHAVGLELVSSLDLEALLPIVLDRVCRAAGAEAGTLWLTDGDGMLRCRAGAGEIGTRLLGAQREWSEIVGASGGVFPGATLTRPLLVGEDRVGAVQVSAKSGDTTAAFDAHDREMLESLAPLAAIALRNARLHTSGQRAEDITLILEISREIGSTLDLDRVLRSVVNLASRALPFDRGAVGLYDKGKCEIRAVAGQETVDSKDPKLQDLIARAGWAAGRGETLYLSDRGEPTSDAERMFLTIFGPDLETAGVQSGLYLPLKDEEGILGVLVFESGTADFATENQRGLIMILANQTAVALRNAQLYNQVPMVDAIGAIAARKQALLALPRRRVQLVAAISLAVLAALTLIRWPLRVPGSTPIFRPMSMAPIRALVPGIVERVMVTEGAMVPRGAPLASLRATALAAEREATSAEAATAERQASQAAARGDAAEERLQRTRADALRREVAILNDELALTTLRAPVSGVVLTPHVEEYAGASLEEGDLLLTLGRLDTLELEFGVDQREVARVRAGQEVRLRVDALPQRTLVGRVISVGQLPADTGEAVSYPVRAAVPNPDGVLKPDMTAYVRVLTAPASTATRLFRGPVRWARLAWWRLWS
ncbi:MAG TPA: efflux RND transporter periplasmic adaptor subunit [Gemmatimonadales bacterium]|nr:efflux RND transporter periplasmic adaptor subunit [Gemmatimonadales bacterium]